MTNVVILPPMLLLFAILSATWLAYGLNPNVAHLFGGLALITLTRRLQWLLLILSILPCILLIARVAMVRARAWWLIGLSIVVALLFVRFSPDNARPVRIVDAAMLPLIDESRSDSDDEFVVGLELQGNAFAFPYRALYRTPVVQLTDFDRRVLLIYSPNANSATALEVTHEIKADDIEFVAYPGNSALVYNRKFGEFIIGITGLTDQGKIPFGVRRPLQTFCVPRRVWKKWHPKSKALLTEPADSGVPGVPLAPRFPIERTDDSIGPEQPITLLHTNPPMCLLDAGRIVGDKIVQLTSPSPTPAATQPNPTDLVLWRSDGSLNAFERNVGGQVLAFRLKKEPAGASVIVDGKSGSVWSREGLCTQGPLKGKRLTAIRTDSDVYWGTSKMWFPTLQIAHFDTTVP